MVQRPKKLVPDDLHCGSGRKVSQEFRLWMQCLMFKQQHFQKLILLHNTKLQMHNLEQLNEDEVQVASTSGQHVCLVL